MKSAVAQSVYRRDVLADGPESHDLCKPSTSKPAVVIVLGNVLLIAGFMLNHSILWSAGVILVVVGLALTVKVSMGRAIGGRRSFY